MIIIKNKLALQKMAIAGQKLAKIVSLLPEQIKEGVTTLELDQWVVQHLKNAQLISCTKGYLGYRHSTCISVNEEVVHGVRVKKKF
jgi:methionyl aminopeptidase